MEQLLNVALLVNVCGEVRGRKKLQKIVHILQEAGHPFREPFGYLHYGPYSSVLKAELDELISDNVGLLDEKEQQINEYSEYVYAPTEKLEGILDSLGVEKEPAWKDLAKDLSKKSPDYLEAVSTILFLRRLSFDGERLKSKFQELKPKLANLFDDALEKANQVVPVRAE